MEQARKVAKVATKHIGGAPNSATIHIARPWKKQLAISAIEHLNSGGNIKAFGGKLSSQKFDKIDLLDLQTKSEYICNNLNLKKVNIREIYPGLYRFECK